MGHNKTALTMLLLASITFAGSRSPFGVIIAAAACQIGAGAEEGEEG